MAALRTLLLAVVLAAPLALGCSSGGNPDAGPVDLDGGPNDDGGVIAAQMNDVSILFPVVSDGGATSIGLLAASASGARGTLLPEALYQAVGTVIGSTFVGPVAPGSVGVAEYADLHVVAMRIDPCFASTAPDPHGGGCLNQLRLIFQEVTLSQGDEVTTDSALHVFYALSRAELEQFVRSVIALRLQVHGAGDLGPLAPHPLLVSGGENGAFASGLRALILAHAGAQNLTRVTRLDANDEVFAWTFNGFDVSNADAVAFTPMVIPTLPDAGTTQLFVRNFGTNQDMQGQFEPETTASDDLAPLANATVAAGLDAAGRQRAFDALVKVENPADFTPNTIDCASCHLATPTEVYNAGPTYGLSESGNANLFVPDARFVSNAEMALTLDPASPFNVHAFSYTNEDSPAINQRTVNETAAIVAYLNTLPSP